VTLGAAGARIGAMRMLILLAGLWLGVAPALANPATDRWAASDECTRRAFELFPDWTREHAAKRDAYVRKCLAERRQPARQGIAPKN
jgi:hypothetical protein